MNAFKLSIMSKSVPGHQVVLDVFAILLSSFILIILLLWTIRCLQYRRDIQLAQESWLKYDTTQAFTEQGLGHDWPSLGGPGNGLGGYLSPIPEEQQYLAFSSQPSIESSGEHSSLYIIQSTTMQSYGSIA